jgi:hypothetical protein
MKTLCRAEMIAVLAVNVAAWVSAVDAARQAVETHGTLIALLG